MAPANTGSASSKRTVVIRIDHTNSGIRSYSIPDGRILLIVVIKFNAPIIEDTPARWREKIAQSTLIPPWYIVSLKGGYTVHPVPAPLSIRLLNNNNIRAPTKNQ